MSLKADLAYLGASELARKYPGEYETHRRISYDAKRDLCVIDPAFKRFADFLGHVGCKPTEEHTLDRTDFQDVTYGPGKCRWATPTEQSNNTSKTVFLRGPDGSLRPLTEWARITGQKTDTMHKRRLLEMPWTDIENVCGSRLPAVIKRRTEALQKLAPPSAPAPADSNPWPASLPAPFVAKYGRVYPLFVRLVKQHWPGLPDAAHSRAVMTSWLVWRDVSNFHSQLDILSPSWRDDTVWCPDAVSDIPAYRRSIVAAKVAQEADAMVYADLPGFCLLRKPNHFTDEFIRGPVLDKLKSLK